MKSLIDYSLNEEYEKVKRLGDRLAEVDSLIDWGAFRPIVAGMYRNKTEKGGRPNIDEVVMVKILVLQQWYGLSDPELERQVADRISFRKFLGFPENIPDYSTVWRFRMRRIRLIRGIASPLPLRPTCGRTTLFERAIQLSAGGPAGA